MNTTITNIDKMITDLTVIAERCNDAASVLDDIRNTVEDIVRTKSEIVNIEVNTTEQDKDTEFLDYCKRLLSRKERELENLLKNKEYIEAKLRVINEFGRSLNTSIPTISTEYDI